VVLTWKDSLQRSDRLLHFGFLLSLLLVAVGLNQLVVAALKLLVRFRLELALQSDRDNETRGSATRKPISEEGRVVKERQAGLT
jgi:hypothetical protein